MTQIQLDDYQKLLLTLHYVREEYHFLQVTVEGIESCLEITKYEAIHLIKRAWEEKLISICPPKFTVLDLFECHLPIFYEKYLMKMSKLHRDSVLLKRYDLMNDDEKKQLREWEKAIFNQICKEIGYHPKAHSFETNFEVSLTKEGIHTASSIQSDWKPTNLDGILYQHVVVDYELFFGNGKDNLKSLPLENKKEKIDDIVLKAWEKEDKTIRLFEVVSSAKTNIYEAIELVNLLTYDLRLFKLNDRLKDAGELALARVKRDLSHDELLFLSLLVFIQLTERGENYALKGAKIFKEVMQTINNYGGQVNVSKDGSTIHANMTVQFSGQLDHMLSVVLPILSNSTELKQEEKNELIDYLQLIQSQAKNGKVKSTFIKYTILKLEDCRNALSTNPVITQLMDNLIALLEKEMIHSH